MEMVAANLVSLQKVGGLAGALRAHSVGRSEPRVMLGFSTEDPRSRWVSGCGGYNPHAIMGHKVHGCKQ